MYDRRFRNDKNVQIKIILKIIWKTITQGNKAQILEAAGKNKIGKKNLN